MDGSRRYEFAAARSRWFVGALMRALLVVPAPVPVILLPAGLCDCCTGRKKKVLDAPLSCP